MGLIAVVEKDPKIAELLLEALEPIAKQLNHGAVKFGSFLELDQHLQQATAAHEMAMVILDLELIQPVSEEALLDIKTKYKCELIVTGFYDPLQPFKKVETWPIINLIYKPFDQSVLKENLKFGLQLGKKLNAELVHTVKESLKIEKIRRHQFTVLSDFGFKFKSKSEFEIGKAYKFYHYIFKDQNKLSLWAKPLFVENGEYHFIFATPKASVISHIRQKITATTEKLKKVDFKGLEKNKEIKKIAVGLELFEEADFQKLSDFFSRHFPQIEATAIPKDFKPGNKSYQLIVSEISYKANELEAKFGKDVLYFHVNNETFKDAQTAEETLAFEAVRITKPIDRILLSKLIQSFFPKIEDQDPFITQWITVPEEALLSETVIASDFSEVGFTYARDKVLAPSSYQEFALSQEDETELKPIKAKIQQADEKPNQEGLYPHQIVFYGIRDDILKKIRLWMLQTHIQKKKSE